MAEKKKKKKGGGPTGVRTTVFGKKIVVDMFTKHGIRRSPGVNERAKKVAKCARGKSLEERKTCFGKK